MAYNPAEGNFSFSDESLERERDRVISGNSIDEKEKHDIQVLFCRLLAQGQGIHKAIQKINGSDDYVGGEHMRVARKTFYMWRKFDQVFRDAWDEAYQAGTERLEAKANEFAEAGNATLLVHMLKIRNPQRHSTNKMELSGPGGSPVAVTAIEFIGVDAVDGAEVEADDESTASPSG